MNGDRRNLLAFGFLVVACVIASLTYTISFLWLFTREVSYVPDLTSGLVSILLVLPVVRGDFLYRHRLDALTLSNLALLFYLTAAFVNIGLGGDAALLKTPTTFFMLLVVLIANLNSRRYGELAVVALVFFGAVNLSAANEAMGFSGFILACCSALGVLFAVDIEKVTRLVVGAGRTSGESS